jgi:SAM-dependent methyltransferase
VFSPPNYGASENFLNPRFGPWTAYLYSHRKPLLDAVREAASVLTGQLLDVGCGNKPYASILKCVRHVGVDVANSPHRHDEFDAVFDGLTLPFENETFDSILCTEVFEHASRPYELAREIGRVLEFGGHALITAPFVIEAHEIPHDLHRFTRFGMERLASVAGLEVVWIRGRGGVFSVAANIAVVAGMNVFGRRPCSDFFVWAMFPKIVLARWLDRWRGRPHIITLGWQMLLEKVEGNDLNVG